MDRDHPVAPADAARPRRSVTAPMVVHGLLPFDGRPVILDIGCGKGRMLRARAKTEPGTWFIGIDLLTSRLRRLARRAGREGLSNIRLWHGDAHTALSLLPPRSITACTVFFPDPWPKRRHHRRRLVTPAFTAMLQTVLVSGGSVELATDNAEYFIWITRVFERHAAFHPYAAPVPAPEKQSDFELLFTSLQRTVYRCAYRVV